MRNRIAVAKDDAAKTGSGKQPTPLPMRLYTPAHVAGVLAYHPESVRRAIRQGRIKAIKCGDGWRVRDDELERLCRDGLPVQS